MSTGINTFKHSQHFFSTEISLLCYPILHYFEKSVQTGSISFLLFSSFSKPMPRRHNALSLFYCQCCADNSDLEQDGENGSNYFVISDVDSVLFYFIDHFCPIFAFFSKINSMK